MNNYFGCVLRTVLKALLYIMPIFIVIFGIIFLAELIGCLLSGPAAAVCLPGVLETLLVMIGGLIAMALVISLIMGLVAAVLCSFVAVDAALDDIPGLIAGGAAAAVSALTAMSCESAQAELERLKQELAAAKAARDARAAEVADARARVIAAAVALATAIAAIAAVAFWRPDLLIATIAAAAVAAALLVRRGRQLAESEVRLAAAEANLVKAIAAVGAATIIVDNICGQDGSNEPTNQPPVGIEPVGGSLGVGGTIAPT
jgi:hypothetical protein